MYNISDINSNYNIDTITCFEHPIAVALGHFCDKCSSCYIMLSKLYGIYMYESGTLSRKKIFDDINNFFGIKTAVNNRLSWKIIKNNIDKGNPVIVGVNLKEIFYSEHYLKKNWGHWMLITGYDAANGTLNIFDNTQYGVLGSKYGDFVISYELLLKASKSYLKKCEGTYSCITFEKVKEFNYEKVFEYIIEQYASIALEKHEVYRTVYLLNMLNELAGTEQQYVAYYSEEFKKKIININKYREAFWSEIINTLVEVKCNIDIVNDISEEAGKLVESWKIYALKNTIKASCGRFDKEEIDDNIVKLENNLQKRIVDIIKSGLKYDNEEKGCKKYINNITYMMENNEDSIISGTDSKIKFVFDGSRLHNWWIEDDAPKVCIVKDKFDIDNKNNAIRLEVRMTVDKDLKSDASSFFQAGFYFRTLIDDKNYVCAVENKEDWVLDRVGCESKRKSVIKEYSIFICVKKEKIFFGTFKNGSDTILLEEDIITQGNFETGLFCKTWNKTGKLEVTFDNINTYI